VNSVELPFPIIAIDGPAASGKSTVAKRLSARLDYIYVNTGAMYRAMTWWLLHRGVDVEDLAAVREALPRCGFYWLVGEGEVHLSLDGVDPLPHLRTAEVNAAVSKVAAVPEVRKFLVAKQRSLASVGPMIVEGRDIGTVVFPDTPFKFYIDADPEIRAARRRAQGEADVVVARDHMDSTRALSPLACAPDAKRIDSGILNATEIVVAALQHLYEKGLEAAGKVLQSGGPLR
jgi:cytidylate kinase